MLMTKVLRAFACILMVAGVVSAATVYTATLDQSQEVPPTGVTATGSGMATLDDTETMLMVSLTWVGLTGAPGAAHIHCCPGPGVNATVAIDFVPAGFPTAPGVFTGTFDLTDAASYGSGFLSLFSSVDEARVAVVNGLNSNQAYFNIHTAAFPSGEIRGDITVVPEPSTVLLMGAGLAGVLLLRRRMA
jgi:hypothetical protein